MSEAQTVEGETTEADSQPVEQTPESTGETKQPEAETPTVTQEAHERMVPISVVQQERKKRQEYQRRIAELEGSQKLNNYDPADTEQVLQHPMVQELLIKQAKQELTDYARERLATMPNFPKVVKDAILKNARGFVNEATTDVETAKLDLDDFIDGFVDTEATGTPQPAPKSFQVATTNVSKTETPGIRPAEIDKILAKPVDSWTDQEADAVEKFAANSK